MKLLPFVLICFIANTSYAQTLDKKVLLEIIESTRAGFEQIKGDNKAENYFYSSFHSLVNISDYGLEEIRVDDKERTSYHLVMEYKNGYEASQKMMEVMKFLHSNLPDEEWDKKGGMNGDPFIATSNSKPVIVRASFTKFPKAGEPFQVFLTVEKK